MTVRWVANKWDWDAGEHSDESQYFSSCILFVPPLLPLSRQLQLQSGTTLFGISRSAVTQPVTWWWIPPKLFTPLPDNSRGLLAETVVYYFVVVLLRWWTRWALVGQLSTFWPQTRNFDYTEWCRLLLQIAIIPVELRSHASGRQSSSSATGIQFCCVVPKKKLSRRPPRLEAFVKCVY